jgi:hypothetical protein
MADMIFPNVERDDAERAIYGALRAIRALGDWTDEELIRAAKTFIDADLHYMSQAGVDRGEVYNEEKAYKEIRAALKVSSKRPGRQVAELVEYAMEAWEAYLDAAGAIEWD